MSITSIEEWYNTYYIPESLGRCRANPVTGVIVLPTTPLIKDIEIIKMFNQREHPVVEAIYFMMVHANNSNCNKETLKIVMRSEGYV